MTSILGISSFYHDSAASIIIDGKIVAAAQEERFTRKKHDANYPFNAIEFVLNFSKLKLSEIDAIVFYEKPFLKFERLLETYVAVAPKGFIQFSKAMPSWLREKLFQKKMLINLLKQHDEKFSDAKKIFFSEHHLSHAASAFYPSPFEEAVVLTLDGVGEWATTTLANLDSRCTSRCYARQVVPARRNFCVCEHLFRVATSSKGLSSTIMGPSIKFRGEGVVRTDQEVGAPPRFGWRHRGDTLTQAFTLKQLRP